MTSIHNPDHAADPRPPAADSRPVDSRPIDTDHAADRPPLLPEAGLRPGQPALWAGRWQQRGAPDPDTGAPGEWGRIVRATKGQPLPATPRPGMRYFYLGTGK